MRFPSDSEVTLIKGYYVWGWAYVCVRKKNRDRDCEKRDEKDEDKERGGRREEEGGEDTEREVCTRSPGMLLMVNL